MAGSISHLPKKFVSENELMVSNDFETVKFLVKSTYTCFFYAFLLTSLVTVKYFPNMIVSRERMSREISVTVSWFYKKDGENNFFSNLD